MPELAQIVWLLIIKGVFEFCVAVPERLEEGMLGGKCRKVKGFAGREDYDLLREVTILRII